MSSYLNEEQQAHVDSLRSAPEKVCGCGWYWKTECRSYCASARTNQLQDDREVYDAIQATKEQCAKIADKYVAEQYPLKDPEQHRMQRTRNIAGQVIAARIRETIHK